MNNVATDHASIGLTVAHGHLVFALHPILVGHYEGDTFAGAEAQLDRALRFRLTERRRLGMYLGPLDSAAQGRKVLIVGDPRGVPTEGFARLPAAEAEAKAVEQWLRGKGFTAKMLIGVGVTLDQVCRQLFAEAWEIVQIAAHGIVNKPLPGPDGTQRPATCVVLGGGVVLGPSVLSKLPVCPSIVFVNRCHLGKLDSHAEDAARQAEMAGQPELAASVADELIRSGVSCVVAAGWAVDDDAEEAFARRFYAEMLGGADVGSATLAARRAAYDLRPESKTWGAYPDVTPAEMSRPLGVEAFVDAQELPPAEAPDCGVAHASVSAAAASPLVVVGQQLVAFHIAIPEPVRSVLSHGLLIADPAADRQAQGGQDAAGWFAECTGVLGKLRWRVDHEVTQQLRTEGRTTVLHQTLLPALQALLRTRRTGRAILDLLAGIGVAGAAGPWLDLLDRKARGKGRIGGLGFAALDGDGSGGAILTATFPAVDIPPEPHPPLLLTQVAAYTNLQLATVQAAIGATMIATTRDALAAKLAPFLAEHI
ncbi:CHAT domain-containing protein [Falsiroseomonas sp. HC035]|uniref:CHAT domain-containing protein n=1 Tax=Falsiroseomonas sp. HC035 TaxID=3390999 RepID=UPI003D31B5C5